MIRTKEVADRKIIWCCRNCDACGAIATRSSRRTRTRSVTSTLKTVRTTSGRLRRARSARFGAAAVVKPDSDGRICLFSSARAHLLVDQMGTLPASRVDTSHAGRLLDSRNQTNRLPSGSSTLLPSSTVTRIVNLTVVDATSAGYVTLYGDVTRNPKTSNLNFPAFTAAANTAVVPSGAKVSGWASTEWRAIVDLQAEIS